ncbi:MAG: DUF4249 domain-containing protein [Bacteroidetes bacterium]|nr:DUF4249 domain-containing protein [Bacteroidota bacterium]
MKKVLIVVTAFIITGTIFSSCEKDVTVDIPQSDSKVVVEGYIETGQYPVVRLSYTLPFFGTISTLNFLQNGISGAVVTVSDGTSTDTLQEFLNYGIYFSTHLTGTAGRIYSLHVLVNGNSISAVTTIPQQVKLDSTWFKVDGSRDSLGFIWAHLTDPDSLGNNYRWFARRINHYQYGEDAGKIKDSIFITPRGSVFDDKFFNGKSFDFGYNRGSMPNSNKADDNNDEKIFFKRGDTVIVKFCSIDRAHFEFWRSEETQVNSNGNPFGSPAPVISNINGGLGIWGGYNPTYDTVIAR